MGEQTKPRRDKGTGGLYYRKTKEYNKKTGEVQPRNYWQATHDLVTDDGKRKRVTGSGATKQLAQRKLQANLEKHFQVVPSETVRSNTKTKEKYTLGEFLELWHSELFGDTLSETVRRKYKRNYERHILDELGHIPLSELTDIQLKKHFWGTLVDKKNERTGKPLLGSSARRNIYKTLNAALKVAVKKGEIKRNPLELVKLPPLKRPEENVPQTAHKAETLLVRMKEDDHPHYARFLLMFLGLRRSERLGLTWSNVKDLNGKDPKIVINQQLARHEEKGLGYYIKDQTKNGKSRTIPIPEPFLTVLRQHKKKMDEWKKSPNWNPKPQFEDLVFLNEDGSLITQNRDNQDWHAVLDHYRFKYWRAHLNRHITATLLADQQPPVSIAVVKTLLGNAEAMAYYYARVTNKAMKVPMAAYGETAFAALISSKDKETAE